MLDVRDSFVMFLNPELAALSIPLNWVMMTNENPESVRIKLNAVNVHFLTDTPHGTLDKTMVSIDILHKSERTALSWQKSLIKILRASGIIDKKHYDTNPDVPVTQGAGMRCIYWNMRDIRWELIPVDEYVHLNASFDLTHYEIIT